MSGEEWIHSKTAVPEEGWQSLRQRHALLPRIALLLTLALLPIGIIAVAQTQRVVSGARDTYLAGLSAQTSRLAAPEQDTLNGAQGIAQGLADALAVLGPSDVVCSDLMRYSSARSKDVVFLGFIDTHGQSECNNLDRSVDFSSDEQMRNIIDTPALKVSFNPSGNASGKPVVVINQPVFSERGIFRGFVMLSVSAEALSGRRTRDDASQAGMIVTFNSEGHVLTHDGEDDGFDQYLPSKTDLAELAGGGKQIFSEDSRSAGPRDYAVIPMLDGAAYALGVWNPTRPLMRDRAFAAVTLLFPLLMWLISLAVALVAIRYQVIRPVRILGRQMRDFAEGRRVFRSEGLDRAPTELREIGETFASMANMVVRDEADLENTVHERDVLIKEVHHRVKNNLQLMSSILSMQSRRAKNPGTRSALRRVQDRLSGLAAVHRGLYETPQVSQVRVDGLLEGLLGQLSGLASGGDVPLDVDYQLSSVTLVPDQAGPLAMLAVEGFTNALKYAGPAADGRNRIRVTLKMSDEDADLVMLEIANTVSDEVSAETEEGLGLTLIHAFCAQLDCRMSTSDEEAGWYVMRVNFKRQEFEASQHTPRV